MLVVEVSELSDAIKKGDAIKSFEDKYYVNLLDRDDMFLLRHAQRYDRCLGLSHVER